MIASDRFRDRLPSATAAVAMQAGFLILMALSFEVVRQANNGRESFITLPLPLHSHSIVIDARAKPSAASLPFYARPLFHLKAPPADAAPAEEAPARSSGICRVGKTGAADEDMRKACPNEARKPHAGADAAPPVEQEALWAAERAIAHTPPRVPCVSLFGGHVGMGGFQKEDDGAMVDPLCALRELRR